MKFNLQMIIIIGMKAILFFGLYSLFLYIAISGIKKSGSALVGLLAGALTIATFYVVRFSRTIIYKPKEKLHRAAYRDDVLEMRKLIQNGFDFNAKDSRGWTPLHYAAFNAQFAAAKFLLKNNAEINFQDKKGLSPLSLAIKVNSLYLVELLLEHGANLQLRHKNGQTIAEFASGIYYINPFFSYGDVWEIRDVIKKAAKKPPKS